MRVAKAAVVALLKALCGLKGLSEDVSRDVSKRFDAAMTKEWLAEALAAANQGGEGMEEGGLDFVAAPANSGSMAGFVFKKGVKGLGYYKDSGAAANEEGAGKQEEGVYGKCADGLDSDLVAQITAHINGHVLNASGGSLCALPGCTAPVCVEGDRVHAFCSRTCARSAGALQGVLSTHPSVPII